MISLMTGRAKTGRPSLGDRVVMTYGEVDAALVFELVRWLGPGAELLRPAEWRPLLAAQLAGLAASYADGAVTAPRS